ncbi:MAG: recombinase family protein [Oscillospiraceae bacterium]|nr:recombinase family protein [Oscillospiraceae bacterium]
MGTVHLNDRDDLRSALARLAPGDCVEADSLSVLADNARGLLAALIRIDDCGADFVSLREGIDTRGGQGQSFFALCRALNESELSARRRDGVERAKEEGRYKGRKPIAVDEGLFDSVVALWQSGQITAREAMARLDLKPNTFYRRIKEMEDLKMKDYKKVQQEIKEEIKEAAKQSRKDLDELKKQVKAEAKEVKKAADEKLELHDVEREMRHDRIRAEVEQRDAVRQMKKDVEAEAKELKKLMENS